MNNWIVFTYSFKRIYAWIFLSFFYALTFAQTTSTIKGVKTDNAYANTTEISKSKNTTDAQVLAEIEGNYGIGDIVRIVVATPKPTFAPLTLRENGETVATNISTATIYNAQRIESKASTQTNYTYKSSSSTRISKKYGSSVKKMSSLFKKTNYKKVKHRSVKNKQKDKCYKF